MLLDERGRDGHFERRLMRDASFFLRSSETPRMKRLMVLAMVSGFVVGTGCGYGNYNDRLEATESRLKDEMTLNRSLAPPAAGDYQKLSVHLRAPIGWTSSPAFAPEYADNPQYEEAIASRFDLRGSYAGPVAASKDQEALAAPPAPPMLRFIGRRKKELSEAEKAEGAPAQPSAERGEFLADAIQLLQSFYGNSEALTAEPVSKEIWPRTKLAKSIEYQRYKFNGSRGQLVHAYFLKDVQGATEYEAALVFEYPDGQAPTASNGPVDLTLGTFAVGARANRLFLGDSEDSGGAGAAEAGPAVAF